MIYRIYGIWKQKKKKNKSLNFQISNNYEELFAENIFYENVFENNIK